MLFVLVYHIIIVLKYWCFVDNNSTQLSEPPLSLIISENRRSTILRLFSVLNTSEGT
jgi:hypothetical protein